MIRRTAAGEPIEPDGQVRLVGADASTPTLAELHEVADRIRAEADLPAGDLSDHHFQAMRDLIDGYCASIGAATDDVDRFGCSHGPHTWWTFALEGHRMPAGIWAGSMTQAVLRREAWPSAERVEVAWRDPDCSIHDHMKAGAKHMQQLERAAAERAETMGEGLLGLLDWSDAS